MPGKKRRGSLQKLLFAILAALLCGDVINLLPPSVGGFFTEVLIGPLFDTYVGILGAMAGPMMFLTVLIGIVSIGDAATLSRIGKRRLLIYLGLQFLLVIAAVLVGLPFFGLSVNAGGDVNALSLQIVTLILDTIPRNVFQPFPDGNSLQIVFEAAVAGFAILMLKRQLRFIVFFMAAYILYLAAALTILCTRTGPSPVRAAGKLIHTFILTLTTASSTASFGTIMETCQKRLGIDSKLSNFGVPLGMVLFAPLLAAAALPVSGGVIACAPFCLPSWVSRLNISRWPSPSPRSTTI